MSDVRPDGRLGLFVAVFGLHTLLDQITKIWAVERLASGDIDVVWNMRFHLARNPGASFSLGRSFGPWFGVVAAAMLVVLFVIAMRQRSPLLVGALGLVSGGVFGNLIDRAVRGDGVLNGEVIDFIEVYDLYKSWDWPVFNIADAGIVCGVILLILLSLRGDFDYADAPTTDRSGSLSSRNVAGTGDPSSLLDRFDAEPMYGTERER